MEFKLVILLPLCVGPKHLTHSFSYHSTSRDVDHGVSKYPISTTSAESVLVETPVPVPDEGRQKGRSAEYTPDNLSGPPVMNDPTISRAPEHLLSVDEEPIASGSFGSVHLGKWGNGHEEREVAVKRLFPDFPGGTDIALEVEILNLLSQPSLHPGSSCVCKLIASSDSYMVFNRLGVDLFEYIVSDAYTPDEDKMLEIMADVSDALDYAHSLGIIHGDVKPENICLQMDPHSETHASLVDWGSSRRFADADDLNGKTTGTLQYKAPEALLDDHSILHDGSCDMWSLGMTMLVAWMRSFPVDLYEDIPQTGYAHSISEFLDELEGLKKSHRIHRIASEVLTLDPSSRRSAGYMASALKAELFSRNTENEAPVKRARESEGRSESLNTTELQKKKAK